MIVSGMAFPTILHIEDDAEFSEVIQDTFEHFGFRGTMLRAETVGEASTILDDVERQGGAIDLIISDMSLPDGTGLDVIRRVRRSAAWHKTPLLVLSAETDPRKIGRAYDLGATNYISKSPNGRRIIDVIRALYDHWMKDAVLPGPRTPDRTHQIFANEVALRARHAAFYMRMAEQFDHVPSEVAFWLSRALIEANLANLIRFLEHQLKGRTLPEVPLAEVEKAQLDAALALSAIERDVEERPITTRTEANRRLLEVLTLFKVQRYAPMLRHLLQVAPAAMVALRDVVAAIFEDLADWFDFHSSEPTLAEQTKSLRASAADLRALRGESSPGEDEPAARIDDDHGSNHGLSDRRPFVSTDPRR